MYAKKVPSPTGSLTRCLAMRPCLPGRFKNMKRYRSTTSGENNNYCLEFLSKRASSVGSGYIRTSQSVNIVRRISETGTSPREPKANVSCNAGTDARKKSRQTERIIKKQTEEQMIHPSQGSCISRRETQRDRYRRPVKKPVGGSSRREWYHQGNKQRIPYPAAS